MVKIKRFAGLALAMSILCGAIIVAPVLGQQVTVVVNGRVMTFAQPPVMRNNRVFVPMRAIFERLGSTVAYSNGVINARGNGRVVHLVIGSTAATVNGNPFTMDVAPFTVAGRTEVPLRFVAQALGAKVNWNAGSETVAIMTGTVSQTYAPTSPPQVVVTKTAEPTDNAVRGRAIFQQNCAVCHGARGQGGMGPSLVGENTRKNFQQTVDFIRNPRSPMPRLYPSRLSAQDVRDVAAYVESL